MIFERLYNRKYTPKDKKIASRIHQCCSYYANRIVRNTHIHGKLIKNKNIYVFARAGIPNVAGEPKIPYSLKLRLEYFSDKGILPTRSNMTLDDKELLSWTKNYRSRNFYGNKRALAKSARGREVYYAWQERLASKNEEK